MDERNRTGRLLHLSEDPGSTAMLRQQLAAGELAFAIDRIEAGDALDQALGGGDVRLLVADLPLPWPGALDQVQSIQRMHPALPVVFRWSDPGYATSQRPDLQLATLIRQELRLSPARVQTAEEQQLMVAEFVLHQQLVLDLGRRATGDTAAVLAEITHRASVQMGVDRVSIWEFDATRTRLCCTELFVRSANRHESGRVVGGHPRYRRALEQALQIAATDAWTDPRTSEFLDDYLRPLNIRAMLDAPIRQNGEVVGVLCFEHTGSPRVWRLLDQCLAALLASLVGRVLAERDRRRSQEIALRHERLAAIGRIAATLVHDVGNQLMVVDGLVDQLHQQAGSAGDAAARTIREQLAATSTRMRQLLAIDRLANHPRATPPVLDLRRALVDRRATLTSLLGPGIHFDTRLPDAAQPVRLHPDELDQVLSNLATNARDALDGRGDVALELARVTPAGAGPARARLVVRDNGPGLPETVQRRLFEPFVTTKPPDRGTGLGLATVHQVVHAAGGTVSVDSTSGGTQFVIDLPLAE